MADSPSQPKGDIPQQSRVMLWCLPRSTSSVFTKCLSFVPDSQVFFEPYYFCYEALAQLRSLGISVDLSSSSTDYYDHVDQETWSKVAELISGEKCPDTRVDFDMFKYSHIRRLLQNPDPKNQLVLLKDVAHSIDGRYEFLPDKTSKFRFAFLLRHPAKVFSSWRKVMYGLRQSLEGTAQDGNTEIADNFHMIKDIPAVYNPPGLFYKELYDLWIHVRENYEPNPVVIDSDDLLADAAVILPKFCRCLDIPFTDDRLHWDASPATTDRWMSAFTPPNDFEFIRIYCHTAFHTSYFRAPTPCPSYDELTLDVRECVDVSMPYYQKMYEHRIRADVL
ncbi:uncharacterized protein [Diadema setosum]|uniref:uncharacterized protein n=1 Tax=Diadema setosum TaxID=31175 RepID=UPI003B3A6676